MKRIILMKKNFYILFFEIFVFAFPFFADAIEVEKWKTDDLDFFRKDKKFIERELKKKSSFYRQDEKFLKKAKLWVKKDLDWHGRDKKWIEKEQIQVSR